VPVDSAHIRQTLLRSFDDAHGRSALPHCITELTNAAVITAGRRVRRSAVMTDPIAAGKPGKTSWKRSTSHQLPAAVLRFQDLLT
jgi:hypothetical protein